MTTQGDLFEIRNRKSIEEKLTSMLNYLACRTVPTPVDILSKAFGWSDRVCRAIVNASEGRIIATESGYILTRNATPEQFSEANGRIFAQARQMLRRALKERSVRHRMIGGK
jgi:ribosomal protein S24E